MIDDLLAQSFNQLSSKPVKFIQNVHVDLDFFHNNENDENEGIYSVLNKTKTVFGDKLLRYLLLNPTTDHTILIDLQSVITEVAKGNSISNYLDQLGDGKQLLWLWEQTTEEQKALHDTIYYNYPIVKLINKQHLLLTLSNFYKIYISPMITILTPFACVFAPLLVAKILRLPVKMTMLLGFIIKSLVKRNFSALFDGKSTKAALITLFTVGMWIAYYIYGCYQTVMTAVNTNRVINLFAEQVKKVENLVDTVIELKKVLDPIDGVANIEVSESINLFKSFLNSNCGMFKGKVLVAYYQILENRDRLVPLLNYVGMADMYNSVASLFRSGYSKVKFVASDKPHFKLKGMFHPLLQGGVVNNVRLTKNSPNMLITGPNMGGKSTYIKTVMISAILAQSIGLVPASNGELCLYSCFNSCLKIPDSTGHASQFEAEMYNNLDQLSLLEKMNKQDKFFTLSVIDEIFTSTNSLEGVSAAISICKKLTKFKRCNTIVTTHYIELTMLEEECNGMFKNYRVCADESGERIKFTYKLEKGVSNQFIALKLIKENGFDHEIVNDAMEVCNKLKSKMR